MTLILAALLAALVVVDLLFIEHHHPVFPWHHLPGYQAALGLISCLVVAIGSKLLGTYWLQRPEDDDE